MSTVTARHIRAMRSDPFRLLAQGLQQYVGSPIDTSRGVMAKYADQRVDRLRHVQRRSATAYVKTGG